MPMGRHLITQDHLQQMTEIFNFSYHMFGSTNTGSIALEVSEDNGDSWQTLWIETGNNGDS